MTTGKTIALTRRTFVGKVMSLLSNMLSRFVITFLPRSKRLLISWLQSPSAIILVVEPEVGQIDSSSSILLKIALAILDLLWPHTKFWCVHSPRARHPGM